MIAKIVRNSELITISDVDTLLCDDNEKLMLTSGTSVVGIFLQDEWSCVWLEEDRRFDNDTTEVIPKIKAGDYSFQQ